MLIKAHQVIPYDQAAKKLEQVTTLLASVNVAGLDPVDVKQLTELYALASAFRSELFGKAHARYVAERAGDVKPGE